MSHPAMPSSDAALLIELFCRRQPTYQRADALRLLRLDNAALDEAIQEGTITPEQDDTGMLVLPWEDLATIAMTLWSPRAIHAALHDQDHQPIPYLNQRRLIRVSLPVYQIRLLDHLARAAPGRVPHNASDILEATLLDLASSLDIDDLDSRIPGFHDALQYPTYTPPPEGIICFRCRYCGTSIREPARAVCHACTQRHEPDEHLGKFGLPELDEEA